MATLQELQAELTQVQAAVNAAYSGAEYEIVDGQTKRRLKRQDLPVLLRRKAELELAIARIDTTAAGGRGPRYAMPMDSGSCFPR